MNILNSLFDRFCPCLTHKMLRARKKVERDHDTYEPSGNDFPSVWDA